MYKFNRRSFGTLLVSLWHSMCRNDSRAMAIEDENVKPCTWLDRSGDLTKDIFYEFHFAELDSLKRFADRATAILSRRNPTQIDLESRGKAGYLWVYVRGEVPDRTAFDCPTYREHQTSRQLAAPEYALRKPGKFGDFVADFGQYAGPSWFVSGNFAERLRASGLKGFRLDVVRSVQAVSEDDKLGGLSVPSPEVAKGLDLHMLTFEGRACRRAWSVRGVKNACPWCDNGPVVCPDCGIIVQVCPDCGNLRFYGGGRNDYLEEYRNADVRPLFSEAGPGADPAGRNRPHILEGKKYDGKDFIYPNFISGRALNWLLEQKAAPFFVVPAVVDVQGLTTKQKERIDAARR